jgi:hypothetical protein
MCTDPTKCLCLAERDPYKTIANLQSRCDELNEACSAKQVLIDHTASDLRDMRDLYEREKSELRAEVEEIGRWHRRAVDEANTLRAVLQGLLDAMRYEEELRSHVLTHDGDCLVHKARAALRGEPPAQPAAPKCHPMCDQKDNFHDTRCPNAQPAATGEGEP